MIFRGLILLIAENSRLIQIVEQFKRVGFVGGDYPASPVVLDTDCRRTAGDTDFQFMGIVPEFEPTGIRHGGAKESPEIHE